MRKYKLISIITGLTLFLGAGVSALADEVTTGTLVVNQVGAVGTVTVSGPTPISFTTASYTNASAALGSYTVAVTVPAGFVLESVKSGANVILTSPYTQVLAAGATATYTVKYVSASVSQIAHEMILEKTKTCAAMKGGDAKRACMKERNKLMRDFQKQEKLKRELKKQEAKKQREEDRRKKEEERRLRKEGFGITCPTTVTGLKDSDKDGNPDVCDSDKDGDTILNATDNCPLISNLNQTDKDNDGRGDLCDKVNDLDRDEDGILNILDNCPLVSNADQLDTDNDRKGDVCERKGHNGVDNSD